MSTPTHIKRKIRDCRGNRRGTIVAVKREDGTVGIGYSIHNPNFPLNKKMGDEVAMERALLRRKGKLPIVIETQEMIGAAIINMTHKAARYFKDCTDIEHCVDAQFIQSDPDSPYFDIEFNYDMVAEEERVMQKKAEEEQRSLRAAATKAMQRSGHCVVRL